MTNTEVRYCILNISIHPHPTGIYIDILTAASKKRAKYWGDHYARISQPIERQPGLYQGRLACWVEINQDEPAVLIDKMDEVAFNDLDIEIPDNIGFNSRIFTYTFRESDHKLFVEIKNEFGKTISAGMVQKIFGKLLADSIVANDSTLGAEVTLIPEEDALEKVLSIPHIKHLKIHLIRPNPDDHIAGADEVIREMEQQNLRSQDIILSAAPGTEGLKPNEYTRKRAAFAEHNGYVEADGALADGSKDNRSTREYARILRSAVNEAISYTERAITVAKNTVVRNRGN